MHFINQKNMTVHERIVVVDREIGSA